MNLYQKAKLILRVQIVVQNEQSETEMLKVKAGQFST